MLFFEKDKTIFGAPEESRLVFARMKNPEKGDDAWAKSANFIGLDLNKAVSGEKSQNVFSAADLKKIRVIDEREVISRLARIKSADNQAIPVGADIPHPEVPEAEPGKHQLKDKKQAR